MSACQACVATHGKLAGDSPRCAFETGAFSRDNWMCGTLDRLRDLCYEGQSPMPAGVDYRYCADQKYATVYIDHVKSAQGDHLGQALWVSWYKNRGSTDALWLLSDGSPPRPPTEPEVLAILQAYGR